MADVFISYKSERRAAAAHLAQIFEANGFSVWWDYSLLAGKDFAEQIEAHLREAKAVIVLWCSISVTSRWVREEATLADSLGKLIPVKIEEASLPLGFQLAQTIDLTSWEGAPSAAELRPLVGQIGLMIKRPASPDVGKLSSLDERWRRFGAPKLAQFGLGKPVVAHARVAPPTLAGGAFDNVVNASWALFFDHLQVEYTYTAEGAADERRYRFELEDFKALLTVVSSTDELRAVLREELKTFGSEPGRWLALGPPAADVYNIWPLDHFEHGLSPEKFLTKPQYRHQFLEDRRVDRIYWLAAEDSGGAIVGGFCVGGPGTSTDHDRYPLLRPNILAAYQAAARIASREH